MGGIFGAAWTSCRADVLRTRNVKAVWKPKRGILSPRMLVHGRRARRCGPRSLVDMGQARPCRPWDVERQDDTGVGDGEDRRRGHVALHPDADGLGDAVEKLFPP